MTLVVDLIDQCVWSLLQFAIECREDLPQSTWLEVPSKSCAPFWPTSVETRKKMVARVKDSTEETLPFDITEPHTTLLQLNNDVSYMLRSVFITNSKLPCKRAIYVPHNTSLANPQYGTKIAFSIKYHQNLVYIWVLL